MSKGNYKTSKVYIRSSKLEYLDSNKVLKNDHNNEKYDSGRKYSLKDLDDLKPRENSLKVKFAPNVDRYDLKTTRNDIGSSEYRRKSIDKTEENSLKDHKFALNIDRNDLKTSNNDIGSSEYRRRSIGKIDEDISKNLKFASNVDRYDLKTTRNSIGSSEYRRRSIGKNEEDGYKITSSVDRYNLKTSRNDIGSSENRRRSIGKSEEDHLKDLKFTPKNDQHDLKTSRTNIGSSEYRRRSIGKTEEVTLKDPKLDLYGPRSKDGFSKSSGVESFFLRSPSPSKGILVGEKGDEKKDMRVRFKHTKVTNFFDDDDLPTPTRLERRFSINNVIIREVDIGQPCDSCSDCPAGFTPHAWRKTCSGCKCPREAHAIFHDEFQTVCERLGFKPEARNSTDAHQINVDARAFNYAWVPPGVTTLNKIEEFFSAFPIEKVPKLGTSGERYRDKQFLIQLPKQDLALAYCKHVPSQYHTSYEDFVSARNEIALDIGYVTEAPRQAVECHTCHETISAGSLCVSSPRFGGYEPSEKGTRPVNPLVPRLWHPACFSCEQCREPLVDLAHCVHDGSIYCERHYAEILKPRCAACDEVSPNL